MELVHCNACNVQPSSEVNTFFISSCCHVFCGGCESEESTRCKVCNKPTKFMKMSSDMPENVRNIYTDTAKETIDMLKKVTFQQLNFKIILNKYLPHLEKKYLLLKENFNKQLEEQTVLRKELEKCCKEKNALSDENEQLKRKLWNALSSPTNNSPNPSIPTPSVQGFRQPSTSYQLGSGDQTDKQRQSRPFTIEALRKTRFNSSGMQISPQGSFAISPSDANCSSMKGCFTPARLKLNQNSSIYSRDTSFRPKFNY